MLETTKSIELLNTDNLQIVGQSGSAQLFVATDEHSTKIMAMFLEKEQALSNKHFFDEEYYLATLPSSSEPPPAQGAGLEHFFCSKQKGDHPHWLFSESYYRKNNRDLSVYKVEQDFGCGYWHFLSVGDTQWRTGHIFYDPELYLRNIESSQFYKEISNSPYQYLLSKGLAETDRFRISWYFDPVWYLQEYQEVREEIEAGLWSCALEHYFKNPQPLKYNPCQTFSDDYYLETYPDVWQAVLNGEYRNGYDHFVNYGALENRAPHPQISLEDYYQDMSVQADIRNGLYRDSFARLNAMNELPVKQIPEILEDQTRLLQRRYARSLFPTAGRTKLDFTIKSASGKADVAVIIVAHDQFDLTLGTLNSLRSCYQGDIELHLVDSGSHDEVRHIDRYVEGANIHRYDKNIGFIRACNHTFTLVKADYVLLANNDMVFDYGSIRAALGRIQSAPDIGAVGGKVIRSHGLLQEAGCIIWRDGSTCGYLRDQDPNIPEANFVRDVDFCSGMFLLLKTHLIHQFGGFDVGFEPAYYEETDLCLRLRRAGYRIVYDPAVVVRHYEYGSSAPSRALSVIGAKQELFKVKHRGALVQQYPAQEKLLVQARSPQNGRKKILFIEDRVPLRSFGSGFTRSNDIIRALSELDYHVTVYPVYKAVESQALIYSDFPDTVEIMYDRGLDELAAFLALRMGYYDCVWVSRVHNAERVSAVLKEMSYAIPINRTILDTEAVISVRNHDKAKLYNQGHNADLALEINNEFGHAGFFQKLIAVNDYDAQLIKQSGFVDVDILGHAMAVDPTPADYEQRQGLLFLGAIHDNESPNLDGIVWFVNFVLPILNNILPPETKVTIAGHISSRVDLTPLTGLPNVELLGEVDDKRQLYNQHRVFVAPVRFAAGISYKIHEAAAFGIPVVATDVLRRQIGWEDYKDIMTGNIADPEEFAFVVAELYNNRELWANIRRSALRRVASENAWTLYKDRLSKILDF